MKSPRAVLFDYGGVLAEEGFALGLRAIADVNGLPGDDFVKKGHDLVHETGFVTGQVLEKTYWETVRAETGISGGDDALRQEILSRFTLRRWMIDLLGDLRDRIPLLGILSDQTNWLEELNERDRFFATSTGCTTVFTWERASGTPPCSIMFFGFSKSGGRHPFRGRSRRKLRKSAKGRHEDHSFYRKAPVPVGIGKAGPSFK